MRENWERTADRDAEELTQVLATVKRQSEEFMETTENSLEMVKQLQQAAVRSNQQYLDSQTVIQETSHALANSISLSKKEFTDVFTWLLESSLVSFPFHSPSQFLHFSSPAYFPS